jgi:Family of unknown function (DUF6519)
MKNDITRDTFDRLKHFSRVLQQQGRVQLDADWNEQISILLDYLRTLTIDLVGQGAGPLADCGFEVVVNATRLKDLKDFKDLSAEEQAAVNKLLKEETVLIAPGRYYVDGLLAENLRFTSFSEQSPRLLTDESAEKDLELAKKQEILLFLDVWERHITPIEDDDIREKALGGPETTTRAKIEWMLRGRLMTEQEQSARKKVTPPKDIPKLRTALDPVFEDWSKSQWTGRGLLRAGIQQQPESDDPCVSSPESVYRGLENQLYRVEIHRPGLAWDGKNDKDRKTAATFKWSRENGSVAAAWLEGDGPVLHVTPSRDQARGFNRGQWIELTGERHEIENVPGTLARLKEVEAGVLTIDPATAGPFARKNFGDKPIVRRWDQEETETISLNEGAIPIQYKTSNEWFMLEDGVQIQFPDPIDAEYQFRSGDYWLIPARVATRDIEWPWEPENKTPGAPPPERRALLPHGIRHHYALIGLLGTTAGALEFTDLRHQFAPLGSP